MKENQLYQFLLVAFLSFVSLSVIGVPTFHEVEPEVPSVLIPNSSPQACVAYNATTDSWGQEWNQCPANHAFFGTDVNSGTCCPLPAEDILTNNHLEVEDACPADYVATGKVHKECAGGRSCIPKLRCTKLNTARYQLGERQPSLYWGNGFSGWQGSQRISWEQIPEAIRYGQGRNSENSWGVDGCVGYPWGSLLTKKSSGFCVDMEFSQLQFRGIEGDPEKGVPVKMFPESFEAADLYSQHKP